MLTINESINGLLDREAQQSGLYAVRGDTEQALNKIERKINNLMDI